MSPSRQGSPSCGAQLDRLLLALRACGSDQYRADPERIGVWWSYCPACASHLLDARRLRISEDPDGRVQMACSTGCTPAAILTALRLAESRYPAGWVGGPECPADQAAVAELALAQLREERRLIAALQHEVAAA